MPEDYEKPEYQSNVDKYESNEDKFYRLEQEAEPRQDPTVTDHTGINSGNA